MTALVMSVLLLVAQAEPPGEGELWTWAYLVGSAPGPEDTKECLYAYSEEGVAKAWVLAIDLLEPCPERTPVLLDVDNP